MHRGKVQSDTSSKNKMDSPLDDSYGLTAAESSDVMGTATTEDDDLEDDDGGAGLNNFAALNGPAIALSSSLTTGAKCYLPTFVRFVPSASTTANSKMKNGGGEAMKNSFSEPPINLFSVRGPSYLVDHKKVLSSSYLLNARGMDLFLTDPHHPIALDMM